MSFTYPRGDREAPCNLAYSVNANDTIADLLIHLKFLKILPLLSGGCSLKILIT